MTRKLIFLLAVLLGISALLPLHAAALTDAQKNTLIAYTDKFLEDGNKINAGKQMWTLQYGTKEVWRTYQLFLSHNNEVYTTAEDGKRVKILYMMNPRGYKTLSAYTGEISGGKGGFLLEGDYLCLDCSAFVALIYKNVFGVRFDYAETKNNNIRNWSTAHYLGPQYEPTLRRIAGSGKNTSMFREIVFKKSETATLALSDLVSSLDKMEVGDLIIGRNTSSGWGHIGFYGGDGTMYHSSSTPLVNEDGTVSPYLMRKQLLSDLPNVNYTEIRVYRLADGILPEDFAGYNVPIDFASLSTTSTPFDNTPPAFVSVKVDEKYNSTQKKTVKIKVTDEFGTDPVVYLADGTSVFKGSAYGESGVSGLYTNTTGVLCENLYDIPVSKQTDYEYEFADGTYYFWVRDAAENVSPRFTVTIGEKSTVTRREDDGSETLISSFAESGSETFVELDTREKPASETTAAAEETTAGQSGNEEKSNPTAIIVVLIAIVSSALIAGALLLSKKKKQN